MKINYNILLFVLLSIFIFQSCEDKLDVEQKGTTSVEDFYQTDEQAEEAIAAVYFQLRSMWFNFFWTINALSDDVYGGGGGRGDNAFSERLNEYTFTPANTFTQDIFSNFYTLIYRCNMIIDHVEGATDVQKRVIAEAKNARAFAYFYLAAFWGKPPLVIHELTSPGEYKQPNSEPAELWAQIEKDLTEAISSNTLFEKSDPNDQSIGGRMTKQFAQSILGKAYLWQEKYSDAASQFSAVIGSNKYELAPDFENLWRSSQDLGSERIFEVIATNDPENATTQGFVISNNILGWRTDHMNIAGFFAGLHDIHFLGWGFLQPTKDAYDAFVEMEGVDGFRLNSSIYTYEDVLNICTVPGLELTVGGQGLYGHEGYFSWKHRILGTEVVGDVPLYWHNNATYLRLGEVLLLGAEASLMSGDESTALDYINQIRTRAQLTSLSSVTLEDIKKEKRLEMWNEGVRYFDLVRWGDAASVMAEKGAKIPTFYGFNEDSTYNVQFLHTNPSGSYGFKSGKHEYLPYPEHEILVNPNIDQNPGW